MSTQQCSGGLGRWFGAVSVSLLLGPCAALAQDDEPEAAWREALAQDGLAAAEAELARDEQTAETAFTLGGVRFLRAIEAILQTRYATHADALPFIPGMGVELPPNPDARFDPAFVETAMAGALDHLAGAQRALETAVAGDFAVEIPLQDIWFDIDANGERGDAEGLMTLAGALIGTAGDKFKGDVRFDSADADWLLAYVHLISGTAELTLAVDPTPAIRTVIDGRRTLESLADLNTIGLPGETWLDTAAATILALRGQADVERTRAAHDHFRAMITSNRAFWAKVALETDNDREWLPNADQVSAFGVAVDEDLAASWQGFLDDIDAILEGETLIPYWRVTSRDDSGVGVGVNLAKWLQDPGDLDPVLWIQGAAAAPYLETGELADLDAWSAFDARALGAPGFILAAYLN